MENTKTLPRYRLTEPGAFSETITLHRPTGDLEVENGVMIDENDVKNNLEISYEGIPGHHMFPLNAEAVAMIAKHPFGTPAVPFEESPVTIERASGAPATGAIEGGPTATRKARSPTRKKRRKAKRARRAAAAPATEEAQA